MAKKNAEKTAARTVQELTGQSYCDALALVRSWATRDLQFADELQKLARATESPVEKRSE